MSDRGSTSRMTRLDEQKIEEKQKNLKFKKIIIMEIAV